MSDRYIIAVERPEGDVWEVDGIFENEAELKCGPWISQILFNEGYRRNVYKIEFVKTLDGTHDNA